ncbi:hypothetical protein BTA51_04625 [Hahella sp. CCB-MM4]|nr:hypothetical protein BTA51_04625 [Hahella sp. CCB-MM4]
MRKTGDAERRELSGGEICPSAFGVGECSGLVSLNSDAAVTAARIIPIGLRMFHPPAFDDGGWSLGY